MRTLSRSFEEDDNAAEEVGDDLLQAEPNADGQGRRQTLVWCQLAPRVLSTKRTPVTTMAWSAAIPRFVKVIGSCSAENPYIPPLSDVRPKSDQSLGVRLLGVVP